MGIWPELSYDNYMKIRNYHDNFLKYKDINPILKWGEGSCSKKKLSFFIPAFKRSVTLQETIESILKQKNALDYEIIICDNSGDLSDDNEIYKFVVRLNNPLVSLYVNEANIGMAGNWNRAFEIPKPDLVAMIHDDDLLADEYLENISLVIKETEMRGKLGFIRVGMKDYKELDGFVPICNHQKKLQLTEFKLWDALLSGIGPTSCPTCGIVFSRKAAKEVGGFSEIFYPSFDYVLGYQILRAGYHGYLVNKELGYYRLGRNESINSNVQVGFVMADFYFREFLYSESCLTKIWGLIFKETQYSASVNEITKSCRDRFNSDVTVKQMDFRKRFSAYPIRWFLFRVIRKIVYCSRKKINLHE